MNSLDTMHSKPGIYLVVSNLGMFFVETDTDGLCHQLKPDTFERDGELRRGRWVPDTLRGIYGPLARPDKGTT